MATSINMVNLGGGNVLFENAVDFNQLDVLSYLEKQKQAWREENFTITHRPGIGECAVNKGGFIYSIEDMNRAPVRIQNIEHDMVELFDSSVYSCLMHYIELFPAVLQCLWWRSAGHVLAYDKGASLGLHCDNDVNYKYGSVPQLQHATRNVLSALVYLNDCTEDEDIQYSFSGGNMTIPYFNIDIRPTKGSILLMPASYLGAHQIHEVTRGTRYSYLSWFAQGSEDSDRGVNPVHPGESAQRRGQWWMNSVIDDYEKYLVGKYGSNIPHDSAAFLSRKNDHA
jgi:hypothetical protein